MRDGVGVMEKMKTSNPLISVIIATLNRNRFLAKAVESALAQSFQNLEIIIIDDGSSPPVTETLSVPDERVRIYRLNQSKGVSSARNYGISLAQGDYLAALDDDDYWKPEYLESVMNAFRRHPEIAMVGSRLTEVDASGNPISGFAHKGPSGIYRIEDIFDYSWPRPSGVVIRKKSFVESGGYDASLKGYEDADLYFKIAANYPSYLLEESYVYYRVHEQNVSKKTALMNECGIRVWSKLLTRRPKGIATAKIKIRLAKRYYRLGRELIRCGDWVGGVKQIRQAVRHSPSVGISFVEDEHAFLKKLVALVKPYGVILFYPFLALFSFFSLKRGGNSLCSDARPSMKEHLE